LRALLAIPADQDVIFKRYSDSASSYVTLDPNNPSIYKQLYRAAKAKLKLRIQVIPVISSDNPEPLINVSNSGTFPRRVTLSPATAPIAGPVEIDAAVVKAVNSYCSSDMFSSQIRETVREEVEKHSSELESKASSLTADLITLSRITPEERSTPESQNEAVDDNALEKKLAFAIYCNSCGKNANEHHYHCEKCDDGDFDLCNCCVSIGKHCRDNRHWLTRRTVVDNKAVAQADAANTIKRLPTRICNNCVKESNHYDFVHCTVCEDFDLCKTCLNTKHGHDPRHAFARASEEVELTETEEKLLIPGRNERHYAICDGCDKYITGIRYKCIDCPNWDVCQICISTAASDHRRHRFVPIFDEQAITSRWATSPFASVKHYGISCDGPVCRKQEKKGCIQGPRFKCAICPDTDFCDTCEASPLNDHNPTHPLIKMKTSIRNVLVSTMEEDNSEHIMGDYLATPSYTQSSSAAMSNAATQVQTVADVKPTEETPVPAAEETIDLAKSEVSASTVPEVALSAPAEKQPELQAGFAGDILGDGAVINAGQQFTQTWFMKNTGTISWPAGVTVVFSGGDYMFLKSEEAKINATVVDCEVQPGETVSLSVDLTATWPAGRKYFSYWRLVTPDGTRFGDRFWCGIYVRHGSAPTQESNEEKEEDKESHNDAYSAQSVADADSVQEPNEEFEDVAEQVDNASDAAIVEMKKRLAEVARHTSTDENRQVSPPSEMIFPKLPVESPAQSVEQLPSSSETFTASEGPEPSSPVPSHSTLALGEEVEVCSLGDESFMTDEEYDVLDGSDEEDYERVG
jgi:next-to-BRCA1 protein 1